MAEHEQEKGILDVSGHGLKKIEVPTEESLITVILDKNNISKIENLECCHCLQQLSIASNRLLWMTGVANLTSLTVLNLPNNSIVSIEGLKHLTRLTWLNLSGNSIKVIEHLTTNKNLQHLDLSDNSISAIADIVHLCNLRTLLLHGNVVTSLRQVSSHLPTSIAILSLAENEISDLNEVSHLICLVSLEQLSVMNNPCVMVTPSTPGFDYRPYIVNWCLTLRVLDGYLVSEKESLKAEWLYSQGQGRHYHPGQHLELLQYLDAVCPLAAAADLETIEEAKLTKILNKQRYHQQQLTNEQTQSPIKPESPKRGITRKGSLDSSIHGSEISDSSQQYPLEAPASLSVASYNREPVKAWTSNVASPISASSPKSVAERRGVDQNDLSIQDVVSDDDDETKSNASLLDSESIYVPGDSLKVLCQPTTTPPDAMNSATTSFAEIYSNKGAKGSRHPTAMTMPAVGRLSDSTAMTMPAVGRLSESKFEAYDKRPIRPLNQEVLKGKIQPNFHISPPQRSITEPLSGAKRRSSPLTIGQDYENEEAAAIVDPNDHSTDSATVPTNSLNHIRNIAESKRIKKNIEDLSKRIDSSRKLPEEISNRTKFSGKMIKRGSNVKEDCNETNIISNISKGDNLQCANNAKSMLNHGDTMGDSGFISRPVSDAIEDAGAETESKAATLIQAIWRGFWIRERDTKVLQIKNEIRARRAEDHIIVLKAELDRQKDLYIQEKELRTLQMAAIRQLWKQVQSLQNWKNEVIVSHSYQQNDDSKQNVFQREQQSASGILNVSDHPVNIDQSNSSLPINQWDVEKQRGLEKTCSSLQSQVSQLQDALSTMSSLVVNGSAYSSLAFEEPASDDTIQVTGNLEEYDGWAADTALSLGHWTSVPHSLSPYPSEEENVYYNQVPTPGCPTPPRELKLEHKGTTCLVLSWRSSKVLDRGGKELHRPIFGYRVFIHDQPYALIAGGRTTALVKGLDKELTYKFYVKAVSALGDSYQSNLIMAALGKGSVRVRTISSSDSIPTDDSDKDSSENQLLLRPRREHRHSKSKKSRSPRTEKKRAVGDNRKDGSRRGMERTNVEAFLQRESSQEEILLLTHPRIHTHRRSRSRDGRSESPQQTKGRAPGLEKSTSDIVYKDKEDASAQVTYVEPSKDNLSPGYLEDSKISNREVSETNPVEKSKDINNKEETVKISNKKEGSPSESSGRSKSPSPARTLSSKESDSESQTSKKMALSEHNIKGHRRSRSKDFQKEMTELRKEAGSDDSTGRSPDGEDVASKQNVEAAVTMPIIDGRKRHPSGSRPTSPMGTDIGENRASCSTPDRRRMPVADFLEQRFQPKTKVKSPLVSASGTLSEKLGNQSDTMDSNYSVIASDKGKRPSNLECVTGDSDDKEKSKSENTSPTYLDKGKQAAMGSDSDVPSVTTSKDADRKGHNNIVAKLLHKLQSMSKSQENLKINSSRQRKRLPNPKDFKSKSRSDELSVNVQNTGDKHSDKKAAAIGVREQTDSSSSGLSAAIGVREQTDSSSSGLSDDSGRKSIMSSYRTHRRTNSDQMAVPVISNDPLSGQHVYSPVVTESSSIPPKSSSSIRRISSFHGTSTSQKRDTRPRFFQSDKTVSTSSTTDATPVKESAHRRGFRSRSPSPAASHRPVISAAQLKGVGKTSPPS